MAVHAHKKQRLDVSRTDALPFETLQRCSRRALSFSRDDSAVVRSPDDVVRTS